MKPTDIQSMSGKDALFYFDLYIDYLDTQIDDLMDVLGMDLHRSRTIMVTDRAKDYLWIELVRSLLTPERYEEFQELISRCELLGQRYIDADDVDILPL